MKNSGQIIIFRIALSITLMIGAFNEIFSQNEDVQKSPKFLILIETSNDLINLTFQEGCAWKELSFTLIKNKVQNIDQNGMVAEKREKLVKDNIQSYFLFSIEKTKNGLSFKGIKGTAWEKLNFDCPKTKCHQYIDQKGMVELK